MNDGFLSYLLLLTSAILLASGWKEALARDVKTPALIMFYFTWCAGLFWTVPIFRNGYAQGVCVAILLLLAGVARRTRPVDLFYLAASGGLIGAAGCFIRGLYASDPVLILYDPTIDIALVCAVLAWTVSRETTHQAAVVTLVLLMVDVAGAREALSSPGLTYTLAAPAFQDGWWLALCAARILSLAGEWIVRMLSSGSRRLMLWMRGLRR
jgi:hypothetical protein